MFVSWNFFSVKCFGVVRSNIINNSSGNGALAMETMLSSDSFLKCVKILVNCWLSFGKYWNSNRNSYSWRINYHITFWIYVYSVLYILSYFIFSLQYSVKHLFHNINVYLLYLFQCILDISRRQSTEELSLHFFLPLQSSHQIL